MANYGFRLLSTHGANFGEQVAWIPARDWLYININSKTNGIGFVEGIISRCRSRDINDLFDVDENGVLDFILEVYRQPVSRRRRDFRQTYIYDAFFIRYFRTELLNDGRPRDTVIGRSLNDLLDRPIIYPTDQVPPVVDHTAGSQAAAEALWGVTPWAPIADETYTGVAGGDTKIQMETLMQKCTVDTPEPFPPAFFGTPVPAAGGGIPDHPIVMRYDRLMGALQELSAASWYANFYGLSGAGLPVDFEVVVNPATTIFPGPFQPLPLQFQTFVGGRGTDRRITNILGNRPIVFSDTLDNVLLPVSISDRRQEITQVVMGGDGTGVARETLRVRNSVHAGPAHSPYNVFERFVAASKATAFPGGISGLVREGWQELRERGYRHDMTMVPSQVSEVILGLDYDRGDLVTVQFNATQRDRQVSETDIKLFNHSASKTGAAAGSNEQVTLKLRSLDGRQYEGAQSFVNLLQTLADRDEQVQKQAEENATAI